jgi:hypothetical protein
MILRCTVHAAVAAFLLGGPVLAARSEDGQELTRAKRFAPILWLAPDEPAYPMLLHPFAFDGIDNNCDTRYDLDDPAEIDANDSLLKIEEFARLLYDAAEQSRLASGEGYQLPTCVEGERYAYGRGRDGKPHFGPQPRVMYVGPADRDGVPGWNRDRAADPPSWDGRIDPTTRLFQYWFYYPFDIGPNPHHHDGEHVSVFVEGPDTAPQVKAVVGAGHESNSVNNVLVAGASRDTPPRDVVLPRGLPSHMPVLVELGKHASAPDRGCNGRFDMGADSNIASESVWGSRDVWAGNVGKALKVGRFETWYSFPRRRSQRLLLKDWFQEDRSAYLEACEDLLPVEELETRSGPRSAPDAPKDADPTAQRKQRLLRTVEAAQGDPELERMVDEAGRTYELFRIADMHELYERLASPACRDDASCRDVLAAFFNEPGRKEAFWGDRGPVGPVSVDVGAARRMKLWADESRRASHIQRRDVWLHEGFLKPETDFRHWLSNRAGIGLEPFKVEGGNLVSGGALMLSDLLIKDSRLELYAHVDGLGREPLRFYDVGVDFYPSRARAYGYYFGLGYTNDVKTNWTASIGVEAYLATVPWLKLPREVSMSLYMGVNGGLFREVLPDKVATAGVPEPRKAENLRFQFGLRLFLGLFGSRHPLGR